MAKKPLNPKSTPESLLIAPFNGTFELMVEGLQCPAGSKTILRTKSGRSYVTDSTNLSSSPDGKEKKQWRERIRAQVYRLGLFDISNSIDQACSLHAEFVMRRPKSHYEKTDRSNPIRSGCRDAPHITTPDSTKLFRGLEDALTSAGVWLDDSYVTYQTVSKRYVRDGEVPHTKVIVSVV